MKPISAIGMFLIALAVIRPVYAQQDSILMVRCASDSTQSYSVFLPPGYDTLKSAPVVFLFDPAAQGTPSVKQYIPVAAGLGFILIGSNNSRNGAFGVSLNAADAMLTDALARYRVDRSRLYLSGFSGGARVATAIALQRADIAGVIACSAGFGADIPPRALSWSLAGIAGTRDFNYIEMQQLQSKLDKTATLNCLTIFKGTHSWPPPATFKKALLWTDLLHHPDEGRRKLFRQMLSADIEHTSSLIEKATLYRQIEQVSPDDTAYVQPLKTLSAGTVYQAELQNHLQSLEKEDKYQQSVEQNISAIRYLDQNAMKTKSGWKTERANLNKLLLLHTPADSDYVFRQVSFITVNAATGFNQYYQAKLYEQADDILSIAEIFDPANPLNDYRRALLAAEQHDADVTIDYLQAAVKKEFPKHTIATEPAFGFLSGNSRFRALLR